MKTICNKIFINFLDTPGIPISPLPCQNNTRYEEIN